VARDRRRRWRRPFLPGVRAARYLASDTSIFTSPDAGSSRYTPTAFPEEGLRQAGCVEIGRPSIPTAPNAILERSRRVSGHRRGMTSTTHPVAETHERSATRSLASVAARDVAAVSPGVIAFGLTLGVTVVTQHSGTAAAIIGSALVFGGSAQLTTISTLYLGAGVITAVLSGALVNARIMLYGAALEPWFRDQPRWFRLLAPHFIIDQTYLSAIAHTEIRGRDFRRYWALAGVLVLLSWTGSIVVGLALGPVLPPLPHLALVATALFVAMLVPKLVDRTTVVAAVVAAAAALLVGRLVPELGILGGTAAGVIAALQVAEKE
jgi:predicted branched-subunit amino acid permease